MLYRQRCRSLPEALLKEIDELESHGVNADSRIRVSGHCPLILPYHIAMDHAREASLGAKKIGTTGRGIGPAYEEKVARRAIHISDLQNPEVFAEKVRTNCELVNFLLTNFYKAPAVDVEKIISDTLAMAPRIVSKICDVSHTLNQEMAAGKQFLFEGAQGTMLDIDHGTYPFVTSSNTVAGSASPGSGVGPQKLNYILGITKAYCTRVGSGPFPTEQVNEIGQILAKRGNEFGAVTGRPRRCGWFDGAALRRAVEWNGLSGLAVMKLDVLDGLETVRLGVGYEYQGKVLDVMPVGADAVEECKPIYEDFPGWKESTFGCQKWDDLPENAKAYLTRLSEVAGAPIALVSTGPDRDQTILLQNPFD